MIDPANEVYDVGANGVQAPLFKGGITGGGDTNLAIIIYPTVVGQVVTGKIQRTQKRSTTPLGYTDCGTFTITAESTVATKPEGETFGFDTAWAGPNANFRVVFGAAIPCKTEVVGSTGR